MAEVKLKNGATISVVPTDPGSLASAEGDYYVAIDGPKDEPDRCVVYLLDDELRRLARAITTAVLAKSEQGRLT